MIDVLVAIEVVEMLAKDVHYRSQDEWFYALHLLADKVDFGSAADDLKEAYYLGTLEELPPTESEIHALAAAKAGNFRDYTNEAMLNALYVACDEGRFCVETIKAKGLPGGVHSILDGVSQMMLTIKGLCWRSINKTAKVDEIKNAQVD